MQALAVEAGHPSAAQALARAPPGIAERTLPSGFQVLDSVLGGFERGRFTFVDASSPLVWDLALGLVCEATRTGRAIAVDGGNSMDPYLVAAHARRAGMPPRHALGALRVARAFTAYQLSAILEETLLPELVDHRPSLLLVSCLPEMYMDDDVPWVEANALVARAVALLKGHARDFDCAVVATNVGVGQLAARPRLRSALYEADRVVRLLPAGEAVALEDLPSGRSARIRAARQGQRTLTDFHGPAPRAPPGLAPRQAMLKGAA